MTPAQADLLRTNLRALLSGSDKWDATTLARRLNRGKDYLNDFLNAKEGRGKRSIGGVEIAAIETEFNLQPGALLKPNGYKLKRLVGSFGLEDPEDDLEGRPEGGVSSIAPYQGSLPGAIPGLEAGSGAGPGETSRIVSTADNKGVTYAADAVRGEIVLPAYLLNEFTVTSPARVHSIRVRGDSMETTLSSGDRVFVDTADHAIGQGGVFVILDHRYDEVLVKRLKRVGRGEKLLIRSDNPKQGDDEVSTHEITVIGRAVARLTRI